MSKVLNGVRIALCTLAALVLVAAFALPKNDVKRAEAFNVTAYGEKVETTLPEDITLEELKAMYIELAGKYNDLIDENNALSVQVDIITGEVSRANAENEALHKEMLQTVGELEAKITQHEQVIEQLNGQVGEWEQKYYTALSERDYYYEQMWALENDVELQKRNAQEWAERYNEAQTNYEAAQDEIALLEINLTEAQNQITALNKEIGELQQSLSSMELLQNENYTLNQTITDLHAEIEALKTELNEQTVMLEAEKQALQEAWENYEISYEEYLTAYNQLESEYGKDIVKKVNKLTELEERVSAAEIIIEAQRAELTALRNGEQTPAETPSFSVDTSWINENWGWLLAGGLIACAALFIIVPGAKRAY